MINTILNHNSFEISFHTFENRNAIEKEISLPNSPDPIK